MIAHWLGVLKLKIFKGLFLNIHIEISETKSRKIDLRADRVKSEVFNFALEDLKQFTLSVPNFHEIKNAFEKYLKSRPFGIK